MALNIRDAEKSDAKDISTLNAVVQAKHVNAVPWLFKEAQLDPQSIHSLMEKDDTVLYVADVDGSVAGYIFAQERHYPDTPLTYPYVAFHVHHICVASNFRRQGIGSALIDAVRMAASCMQVRRLTVDVWDFNEDAKRLFERAGISAYQLRLWQALDV